MSPQEQRIAIAEACDGDDPHWECPRCGRVEPTHVSYEERHAIEECLSPVHWVPSPDYPNDLNAMHEAEKTKGFHRELAPNSDTKRYREELMAICLRDRTNDIFCATAAQRAEAFLRTLNIWKD